MSEERALKFVPKPTGSSNFSHRFWNVVSLPTRRLIPGIVVGTVVWTILYNVSVRLWKGPDHPVNRFQWSRMEKAGTIPDELLEKKKTLLGYYQSRIFGLPSDPIRTDMF